VHIAVRSLGLDELGPFDPQAKVIEYRVRDAAAARLGNMSLRDFADQLSLESPTPGGGSVAALVGALSAGLIAMVANLTHDPRRGELPLDELESIAVAAQGLKDEMLAAVDEDAAAFERVLAALRLPQKSEAEVQARGRAVREATRGAAAVPLAVLERSLRAADLAARAAAAGSAAALSDAGVAALCAAAAAEAAYDNVLINLANLQDPADAEFVRRTRDTAERALDESAARARETRGSVRRRLEKPAAQDA
jgi:glutamate formiminotransferase/formiminotetrahydrofolate cyclodeaminase